MKRISIILYLLIFTYGCSHNIKLNPNIQPNSFVNKKISSTVGVIISNDLKTHNDSVNPSSYAGTGHTYIFNLGEPLSGALMRSVQVAYQDAIEINIMDNNVADKVIKFTLKQSNIDVNFQPGLFVPNARANCSISVGIEAYDGKTSELLQMTTVNGSGFSSQSADVYTADKSFAIAAENAIQQISDNVANLLISGFAEKKGGQNSETSTTSEVIDIIVLKSGSLLEGAIISKKDNSIDIKLLNGKIVTINNERIEKIETKIR